MNLRRHILLYIAFLAFVPGMLAAVSTSLGKPDIDAIHEASINSDSEFYYPKLLKHFLANDTTMTDEQFQYFYYGTLFQEDYDPYRAQYRPKELAELRHIYFKEKPTRVENQRVLDFATAALADNPINIQQIVHRIHALENMGKYDLAKIWQYKLNHLLLVIAASGTGNDPETARIVVYPEHEYDLLNLVGYTATSQQFEAPHYDRITVQPRNPNDHTDFYFDISEILRQYFLKHPSELIGAGEEDGNQ